MAPQAVSCAPAPQTGKDIYGMIVTSKAANSASRWWVSPLVIALGFFLLLKGECSATAVVVIIRNGEIGVAADSKQIRLLRLHGKMFPRPPVCKIGEAHNFVWASAGFSTEIFPSRLMGLVDDKVPGTLSDKAKAFAAIASNGLKGTLWEHEQAVVMFLAFTDGLPHVIIKTFQGTAKKGLILPDNDQIDFKGRDDDPIELGSTEAVGVYHNYRSFFLRFSPVDLAEELVEVQIKETPERVGPPISALSITTRGVEWKEPGPCTPTGAYGR